LKKLSITKTTVVYEIIKTAVFNRCSVRNLMNRVHGTACKYCPFKI